MASKLIVVCVILALALLASAHKREHEKERDSRDSEHFWANKLKHKVTTAFDRHVQCRRCLMGPEFPAEPVHPTPHPRPPVHPTPIQPRPEEPNQPGAGADGEPAQPPVNGGDSAGNTVHPTPTPIMPGQKFKFCLASDAQHDFQGSCVPASVACGEEAVEVVAIDGCPNDEPEDKLSCSLCTLDGFTWCSDDLADEYAGACISTRLDAVQKPVEPQPEPEPTNPDDSGSGSGSGSGSADGGADSGSAEDSTDANGGNTKPDSDKPADQPADQPADEPAQPEEGNGPQDAQAPALGKKDEAPTKKPPTGKPIRKPTAQDVCINRPHAVSFSTQLSECYAAKHAAHKKKHHGRHDEANMHPGWGTATTAVGHSCNQLPLILAFTVAGVFAVCCIKRRLKRMRRQQAAALAAAQAAGTSASSAVIAVPVAAAPAASAPAPAPAVAQPVRVEPVPVQHVQLATYSPASAPAAHVVHYAPTAMYPSLNSHGYGYNPVSQAEN